MYTSQQIKAHIAPLLDSTTKLHCVINFGEYTAIQFNDENSRQARSVLAYHLGDNCYRVETSEIYSNKKPEITDKELTDDLMGWLTDFLSVGVFTVVSEELREIEIGNQAGSIIEKKVKQKTTEQLQADEFNKFSKLAQNSKGIEFTINLTTNSLAYRLSVKLQNPRTGNKITIYQFRNSSTIGLTTIYANKFSEPLRQYNLKHTAELQHIFNACIEKLATRDRV